VHSKELKVIGSLPAGLEGVFARTGPNPEQLAGDYHWYGRGVFVSELQGIRVTLYSHNVLAMLRRVLQHVCILSLPWFDVV